MKFNNIMHVSFFTDQMDAMRDFYENKLGLKAKMIVRYEAYKDKEGHPWAKAAKERPLDICLIYIEIANGQFIELFPKADGQKEHPEYNQHLGYSHFSLTVDDIFKARDELIAAGIDIDIEPKIGNSHTWQMWIHDPDGNRIEMMQYTDESFQITGNIEDDKKLLKSLGK